MNIAREMNIESLEVENFKSIAHINLKHLDMLSVFVGNNGAGKTAIFDTMRFKGRPGASPCALRQNQTVCG